MEEAAKLLQAAQRELLHRRAEQRKAADEASRRVAMASMLQPAPAPAADAPPADWRTWSLQNMPGWLPSTSLAQLSAVVRVPNLLNGDEIGQLEQLRSELPIHRTIHEEPGDPVWETTYLNCERAIEVRLPSLRRKLVAAMRAVDATHWNLFRRRAVAPRVIEFHRYTQRGAGADSDGAARRLLDAHHCDLGSLVTMDVMLSSASEFEGGIFQTMGVDGNYATHSDFERGDALFFLSHKAHSVSPIVRGERRVLIVEMWEGREKHCDVRCDARQSCHCEFLYQRRREREAQA